MPTSIPNVHKEQNCIYVLDNNRLQKELLTVPPENYSTAHEIIKTIKNDLEKINIRMWMENNGRIAYQNIGNEEQTLKIDPKK